MHGLPYAGQECGRFLTGWAGSFMALFRGRDGINTWAGRGLVLWHFDFGRLIESSVRFLAIYLIDRQKRHLWTSSSPIDI